MGDLGLAYTAGARAALIDFVKRGGIREMLEQADTAETMNPTSPTTPVPTRNQPVVVPPPADAPSGNAGNAPDGVPRQNIQ